MRNWLSALGLSAILVLSGCASVPVSSILPLMRIDLATTRVTALRVALQLPEGLRPRPGGVTLDLVLKRQGQPDRDEHLLLVETEGAADLAGLVSKQQQGFRLTAYRLSAEDVSRFEAIQAELATARQQGIAGALGFGIAAREFCLTGAGTPRQMLASTYLMTAESGEWLTVTERFDLNGDRQIAQGLTTLEPCQ